MTENANRYPEPHEGTVHVVRKAGIRIKAISCELSATSLNILLRFESSRQASILSRTACASSSFQRPTPWFLYKTVRCHPERVWRIYYRGEESRYEDKSHQLWAVSCKLNILLRFKSLRQAGILSCTACASSLWIRSPAAFHFPF